MSNADPRVRDPAEGTGLLGKQVEWLSHLRFCCKPGEFLAPVVLLATLTYPYRRDRSYTMTKETEDISDQTSKRSQHILCGLSVKV